MAMTQRQPRLWLRTALAPLTLRLSGPAWALPVCERTPQVRDAILSAVQAEAGRLGSPYPYACEDVTRLSRRGRRVLTSSDCAMFGRR